MLKAALSICLSLVAFMACGKTAASQSVRRSVPPCAAAVCEEQSAFIAALDTLSRHEAICGDAPPAVLRTLHLAPYTAWGDAVLGKGNGRLGIPTSPVVMRMEDVRFNTFQGYWPAVRIVDTSEVSAGAVPPNACLFVFAPVTWLGEDQVRVTVAESRERPAHLAQRFVFLRRTKDGWFVTKVETGARS
jgi:hypothetical protein